jgi:hypothetical protein
MTIDEEIAKCQRMIDLAKQVKVFAKEPLNVGNIPGEIDRALGLAWWNERRYRLVVSVHEGQCRHETRLAELRGLKAQMYAG